VQVALVEYGVGNVGSVANALDRIGARVAIARDGVALRAISPDCIVMPGVGAIGEALALLRKRGLEEGLNSLVVRNGVPFLGICVGMQVMGEQCEEFGEHRGFGWIPGRVGRLAQKGTSLRLPHVGWNQISLRTGSGFPTSLADEHFYFVHSYAMSCPDEFVAATADYGGPFTAAVRRGHMVGVQFHPEKSSEAGAMLLRSFVNRTMMATA
jgi:imidazole glycerol-phosphate synthase subunit HisH